jgi:hypothetical protein
VFGGGGIVPGEADITQLPLRLQRDSGEFLPQEDIAPVALPVPVVLVFAELLGVLGPQPPGIDGEDDPDRESDRLG